MKSVTRIRHQLSEPVKLEFSSVPLMEALEQIGNRVSVSIEIDESSLAAAGISREMPINLRLSEPIAAHRAVPRLYGEPLPLGLRLGDQTPE